MNNKTIGRLFGAVLCAALLFLSSVTAYADDSVTVNDQPVKAGDTVTFEFRFGSVSDPLEAAEATIEYDPKALEYVDGSIGFDVFKNAVFTADEGLIYYSAIDVINGFDFSKESMAVKLSFKVLDSAKGKLTITHRFGEIYTFVNEDEDLTPDDYTSRAITTVNTYKENDSPNKGLDAEKIDEFKSSPETDIEEFILGTDREAYISAMQTASSVSNVRADPATADSASSELVSSDPMHPEVTLSETSSDNGSDTSRSNVIVFVVIAAIIVIAAAAIVLLKNSGSKTKKKEEL